MNALRIDGIDIDLNRISVRRDGAEVHLTPTEFRLLVYLARNPGRVVSQLELYRNSVRQPRPDPEHQGVVDYIKILVRRLRAKLGQETIHNVRGFGYMVEAAATTKEEAS